MLAPCSRPEATEQGRSATIHPGRLLTRAVLCQLPIRSESHLLSIFAFSYFRVFAFFVCSVPSHQGDDLRDTALELVARHQRAVRARAARHLVVQLRAMEQFERLETDRNDRVRLFHQCEASRS